MHLNYFVLLAPPPDIDGPTEAELEEKWDDGVNRDLLTNDFELILYLIDKIPCYL